jgi:uncharacterized repeat protein (TIGR04076 family)
LNIDINNLSDTKYKKLWKRLGKVEIKLIEKIGKCKHKIGEKYIYTSPYEKPRNVCHALLHVLDLYTWRVALGFPSWESDDRSAYRIHCPSKKGTVWEMRKIEKSNGGTSDNL